MDFIKLKKELKEEQHEVTFEEIFKKGESDNNLDLYIFHYDKLKQYIKNTGNIDKFIQYMKETIGDTIINNRKFKMDIYINKFNPVDVVKYNAILHELTDFCLKEYDGVFDIATVFCKNPEMFSMVMSFSSSFIDAETRKKFIFKAKEI
jgi:hypothetical protein